MILGSARQPEAHERDALDLCTWRADRSLVGIQISQEGWQLGDVVGDAPSLVHGEHLGRVSISSALRR